MSLNMEPEEFLPLTVDAGFYIMVHQAGAQEEVFDNAVYAPPGATTYIGVSKTISKNLKEPYKNPCQDHWPPELEKYVVKGIVYTKRACDEYCYQVHIFEKCGCRSFNHIRVFAPQLMESPMNPEGSELSLPPREGKGIHVRVVVFMRSTKVLYKSKEPKLTLSNLFRNIGGLMGVYLGYSSLQIFHVLDVLVDGAYSSLSGVWSRHKRNRQRKRKMAYHLSS
ncbi:hypothetical protein HPB51_017026 [Rhipicephalus microplus]|uniref:Amiloride-sensitive sodium channel n=1 Tax=Rhipicephalus microplus TaxID=6941 RepID=A0A9J6F5R4_RHIMP|nr:hypothetical protein HPB51_017026 [Rhipicephalus microplus]